MHMKARQAFNISLAIVMMGLVATTCADRPANPIVGASTSTTTTSLPTPTTIGVPVDGNIPVGLLDQILSDAAMTLSVPLGQLQVVVTESVVWPDGSLGCPEPGFSYTQALVDGYRVVIVDGKTTLDYHAAANGTFKLCPSLRVSNPPDK